MAETTVTHTESDPPDPTTSAAAIAGAIAGAAGEKADNAQEAADDAAAKAENAEAVARMTASESVDKVSREEAGRIADERFMANMAALAAQARAEAEVDDKKIDDKVDEKVEAAIPKQVLPPSVEKANKGKQGGKRTFNDWWHGNNDDD